MDISASVDDPRRGMKTFLAVTLVTLVTLPAAAQVTWRGDLETGDTSQFSYLLNPEIGGVRYTTVVDDIVAEGAHALRIELHNDAVWSNGLKRVEVQHGPAAGLIAEGNEIWFAWSFYLPEALPTDPEQTIGYWESAASYHQLMALAVIGQDLRFSTNLPDWTEHWTGRGVATPGVWHRIALHVLWSTDPTRGTVDVWFDGDRVVTAAHAATLADTNPAFVQFGLLRDRIEFTDVPVIYLDDAIEGHSLTDVHYDALPGAAPDAGISVDAGAVNDAGVATADAGVTRDAGPNRDAAARIDAGLAPAPNAACGCRAGGGRPASSLIGLGVLVLCSHRLIRRRSVSM